jgi:spore photoproduct lyase
VFTWSLSPEGTARSDEMLTAPLDQRIAALSRLSKEGFRVAVRLDPILYREGWEQAYRELLETLFNRVEPDELDFVILGTFRFPRGFDRTIEERFPNRDFLREEFVEGPDGKFRYPRSLRTEVFRTLSDWLEQEGVQPDLCMEPGYVWEDADIEKTPGQHA